jgi:hypothetical protein
MKTKQLQAGVPVPGAGQQQLQQLKGFQNCLATALHFLSARKHGVTFATFKLPCNAVMYCAKKPWQVTNEA